MSMLSSGLTWLAGAQLQHLSVSIIYSRGRTHVLAPINAIPGRPNGSSPLPGTGGRVSIDDERLDFHIDPDALDFGAGPTEPQRGDQIEVQGLIREVCPDDTQPEWARSDVEVNLIRVRTRLKGRV